MTTNAPFLILLGTWLFLLETIFPLFSASLSLGLTQAETDVLSNSSNKNSYTNICLAYASKALCDLHALTHLILKQSYKVDTITRVHAKTGIDNVEWWIWSQIQSLALDCS